MGASPVFPRLAVFVDDDRDEPSVAFGPKKATDGTMLADMWMGDNSPVCLALAEAAARRVVACCNACRNIPTDELERLARSDDASPARKRRKTGRRR